METPILTPMQLLKKELEESISQVREVYENYKNYHPNDVFQARSIIRAVERNIELIDKYLPKEQEAIVDAFDHGQANHCPPTEFTDGKQYFEQYFNQTYKETQNKQ